MLMGVTAASAPPQIITSASSRWMMRKESPMVCALVVQAVAVAEFGPFAPVRIDTQPEARLTMVAGMKNGEMRPGTALQQLLVLALDHLESADAAADVDAGALGFLSPDSPSGPRPLPRNPRRRSQTE